jgi:hypothetical protein
LPCVAFIVSVTATSGAMPDPATITFRVSLDEYVRIRAASRRITNWDHFEADGLSR